MLCLQKQLKKKILIEEPQSMPPKRWKLIQMLLQERPMRKQVVLRLECLRIKERRRKRARGRKLKFEGF